MYIFKCCFTSRSVFQDAVLWLIFLAPGVSNGKHRRNLMSLGMSWGAPSGSHICSHKHTGSAITKVRKGVFSLLGPENPPSMASKTGLSLAEAEMELKNGYVMPCSHQTNLYHHPDSGSNGFFFEWATRLKSKLSQRLRRRVSHDC